MIPFTTGEPRPAKLDTSPERKEGMYEYFIVRSRGLARKNRAKSCWPREGCFQMECHKNFQYKVAWQYLPLCHVCCLPMRCPESTMEKQNQPVQRKNTTPGEDVHCANMRKTPLVPPRHTLEKRCCRNWVKPTRPRHFVGDISVASLSVGQHLFRSTLSTQNSHVVERSRPSAPLSAAKRSRTDRRTGLTPIRIGKALSQRGWRPS